MRRLLVALLLGLPALTSAQAVVPLDTTVYMQVRTRRASTGKTTVTATIIKAPRVDTVLVVQRDTVFVPKSTGVVVVGDTVKVPYTQVRYGPFTGPDSADVFLGLGSEYLGRITPNAGQFRVSVYTRGLAGLSPLGDFPTRAAALAALYALWMQ